jgi:putative protein-disulfide isomerase
MNSQQLDKALKKEIPPMSMMPINGFFALVLINKQTFINIPIEYKDWRNSYALIMAKL